jgi:hypothetical protein
MIDFGSLFDNATVAGVPLLLFVIAIVQEIKQDFNLDGQVIRIVALVTGLVLGIGYQMTLKMPVGFEGWFTVVIFGALLGLGASRLYDAGESLMRAARVPDSMG